MPTGCSNGRYGTTARYGAIDVRSRRAWPSTAKLRSCCHEFCNLDRGPSKSRFIMVASRANSLSQTLKLLGGPRYNMAECWNKKASSHWSGEVSQCLRQTRCRQRIIQNASAGPSPWRRRAEERAQLGWVPSCSCGVRQRSVRRRAPATLVRHCGTVWTLWSALVCCS